MKLTNNKNKGKPVDKRVAIYVGPDEESLEAMTKALIAIMLTPAGDATKAEAIRQVRSSWSGSQTTITGNSVTLK